MKFIVYFVLLICFVSCTKKVERPIDCVQEFIIASREHDIPKAWKLLGPGAAAFYNDLGEKNRKSGKGILEHDISEVKKFRLPDSDYKIMPDPGNNKLIRIETIAGETVDINVVEIDGEYMIKDAQSVRNLLKSIAAEKIEKDYY